MGRRYKNIYLGGESAFKSVKDIRKPGLDTRKEFVNLVFATLLDLYDGYTRDHSGKRVKYTVKKFNGRMLLLRRLNRKYRFGYSKLIDKAHELGVKYLHGELSEREFLKHAKALGRKYHVNVNTLVKKVNR